MKRWLACISVGYFFMLDVLPPATTPPCQPDRMGREPQPPRLKSEAQRNDEGRQGEGTPERFSSKLISRSAAEVNQKISGWLAGRWRLHGGAAVDAAMLFV